MRRRTPRGWTTRRPRAVSRRCSGPSVKEASLERTRWSSCSSGRSRATGFAVALLVLGRAVASDLVQRGGLEPKESDQIVFGAVIPVVQWPNIAREVGLAAGLPKNIEAYSVARACATSLQALTAAADAIATGE